MNGKDVYQLNILEAPKQRPPSCVAADPDNDLCQLSLDSCETFLFIDCEWPGFCHNGQCEGLPDEDATMSKRCLEDSKDLFNVSHAQDRWLRASFAQVGSTIYVQTHATWHETASSYIASSVNTNRWDLYMLYEQWAHNCVILHHSSLSTAGRTNAQLNHRFTIVLLTVKQWLKYSKNIRINNHISFPCILFIILSIYFLKLDSY